MSLIVGLLGDRLWFLLYFSVLKYNKEPFIEHKYNKILREWECGRLVMR